MVEESGKLKIVVGVNGQKKNKQIQLNINSIKNIYIKTYPMNVISPSLLQFKNWWHLTPKKSLRCVSPVGKEFAMAQILRIKGRKRN